ncbi:MAG TPA: lysophospholipid acyltransferase family protein [Caulobacteraceae bacterium]|jgi:KDO2-lipid IV(A) lauroyltransferase
MARPRSSFGQDLVWRLEAFGYDLFLALFRLLSVDAASALGGRLLKLVGPLSGPHKTASRNLRLAFPEKGEAWRQGVLAAQWENLGRTSAEFAHMDRLLPGSGRVEIVNAERLHAIAREGRPAVLVGGHFANWEMLGVVIVNSGVKCQVTYRAANNPYIDRRIIESRRRYGVQLFAPKGGDGARELLEAMGRGESVGIMNDQKFNGGVGVPFFGRTVYAAPGPTRLALRHGGIIDLMSVQRLNGARFRVTVYEPIVLERTGDRAHDIEQGVRRITAFLEERIREKPEDWFWVHKRWPAEAYASLDAG